MLPSVAAAGLYVEPARPAAQVTLVCVGKRHWRLRKKGSCRGGFHPFGGIKFLFPLLPHLKRTQAVHTILARLSCLCYWKKWAGLDLHICKNVSNLTFFYSDIFLVDFWVCRLTVNPQSRFKRSVFELADRRVLHKNGCFSFFFCSDIFKSDFLVCRLTVNPQSRLKKFGLWIISSW